MSHFVSAMWWHTPVTETKAANSAESPLSVREVSSMVGNWIGRLGRVWVEGQLIDPKQYGRTWYVTLRDIEVKQSFTILVDNELWQGEGQPLSDGARVVVQASVEWFNQKGNLQLRAHSVKPVGEGDLLARIELLRRQLAAEGIFDAARKRPLPFLPRKVGMITGRATDAQADFKRIARTRWPATRFEVREIQLMAKDTPQQVIKALDELQADPEVDVIVITRGGGSFEDLLPWSDETLVRAVAKAYKPVVSAIGHENDRPVLDDAADVRASTPTDAANRVVPSLQEERARVDRGVSRLADLRSRWLTAEGRHLAGAIGLLRAHAPKALVASLQNRLAQDRAQLTAAVTERINQERQWVGRKSAALVALSPYAVLARGYALATTVDGTVIRSPEDLPVGTDFRLKLQDGEIDAKRVKEGNGNG